MGRCHPGGRFGVGTGHARFLLKTTPYVFVGFHFERWYTQLFLRYLSMNANRFVKYSHFLLFVVREMQAPGLCLSTISTI